VSNVPKAKTSQLDRYADVLSAMEAEGKSYGDMVTWLAAEGCDVSVSTVCRFMGKLRDCRQQEKILERIADGAAQIKRVKSAFEKAPAPELETLMDMHKAIVHQLTTEAVDKPELLKLSDQLANTVIAFVTGQTKARQKERQLDLDQKKFDESKKDERAKALDFCLAEAKQFPSVQELFKAAFAALKEARKAA
jgi:hypothetical protein